eukprot:87763_1
MWIYTSIIATLVLLVIFSASINKYFTANKKKTNQNTATVQYEDKYNIPTEIPYSLQQIINFASNIINKHNALDLDWTQINKDIKMQCIKYSNNKDKLKRLYYNYDAPHKNDYMFTFPNEYNQINKQRFDGQHSIIHFVFGSLFGVRMLRKHYSLNDTQMHKARMNGCKIIKLLIENDIITGEEIFLCYSFGVTIIEEIADAIKRIDSVEIYSLLHENDEKNKVEHIERHYKQYQLEIIEVLIDLLATCCNKVYTCSILTNEIVWWR